MKLIGIKEVCDRLGLSRTTVTTRLKDFPAPRYIGYRRLYPEHLVEEWIGRQITDASSTPPKRERKPQ